MPTDEKPSKNEDEYFARQNAEKIKEMRAKLDAERTKAERSAHLNKCPRCGADLKEQHVEHVKIDECQDCGGVWLDRGELDQLGRVNQSRGVSGGVLGSLFKRR
jgi:DNA repair exonuclease SbcCD ATPase subunit